jgi:Leucine-rich repeat (LRR) protein
MKLKHWVVIAGGISVLTGICFLTYYYTLLKNRQAYFDDLTEALHNPEHVEVLILRNQGLQQLPPEIKKFRNLKTLNLGNNKLTSLPAEVGLLTELRQLVLSNNELKELPAEVAKLNHLAILDLSSNHFENIPPVVFLLDSLTTLTMASNKLTTLDVSTKPRLLAVLDFADNEIASVSNHIGELKNLKKIDLENNVLKDIPDEVFNIPGLTEMILRGNVLSARTMELYREFNLKNNAAISE